MGVSMQRSAIVGLKDWIKSRKRRPLVIRGARQTGKSTLVRMFAEAEGLDLIEINLERHAYFDRTFATLDVKVICAAIEDTVGKAFAKNSLLFLDEIQATPQALAALRYFFEERPELPVIAAGSLLELVLPDIEFAMPVGRIEYFHLGPLTFVEYLRAMGEDRALSHLESYEQGKAWTATMHQRLTNLMFTYMQVGGMPDPLACYVEDPKDTRRWMQAQQRIIDTYQDDFNKYRKRGDWAPILQQVYLRLPASLSQKIKYAELAPGQRVEKIHQAIDMLIAARVALRASHVAPPKMPLAAHASPKVFKAYWLDIGLLGRLLGWGPATVDVAPSFNGLRAEQFVAQHLAYIGAPMIGPELFYWLREGKLNNAEVDFVAAIAGHEGTHIVPIEVKSGPVSKMLSLKQFIETYRPPIAVRLHGGLPEVSSLGQTKLLSLPLYMVPFLAPIVSRY